MFAFFPNVDRFATYYVCESEFHHLYVQVLVHGHSGKCECMTSNFIRDLGTIVNIANINMSRTLGGLQYTGKMMITG